VIKAALAGKLGAQAAPKHLFEACDKYLEAKEATANTTRVVEFERERLEVVKRYLGDIRLSWITGETIEGFQAKRRVDGASNRTVNMDVGALRRVLKRFKHSHRLEDDVKMLTESGGAPIGRVLSDAEQERLFEVAKGNSQWTHVYCAGRPRGQHVHARCRDQASPPQRHRP
jgi:hypothetical protein